MKIRFNGIAKEIANNLANAEHTIKIAVAWFTNEYLFDLICNKQKSNVKVELLIIDDIINNNSEGLNFQKLIDLGGDFYFGDFERLMHHKFCVIDNRILINGSYNWTYFAEYRNLENIHVIEESESIEAFSTEFNRIISNLRKVKAVEKNNETSFLSSDRTLANILADDNYYKSFKYESVGDYDRAVKLAKRAIEYNSSNKQYNRHHKNIEVKLKNSSSAQLLPTVANVNDIKYRSFNSALKEGVKCYKKKEYERAIEYFDIALKANEEYGELYFWKGLCYWKLQKTHEIIATCNKAINLNSKYFLAYNLLGIAHSENNNTDLAIENFSKTIMLKPRFYKAYFNRGLMYKKKHFSDKATADFKETIKILTEELSTNLLDEEAFSIRGDAFSLINDSTNSALDYQKAKEIFDSKDSDERDLNFEKRIKDGLVR